MRHGMGHTSPPGAPGGPRTSSAAAGDMQLGMGLAAKEGILRGLEHQGSDIPAEWHTALGASGGNSGHVRLSLGPPAPGITIHDPPAGEQDREVVRRPGAGDVALCSKHHPVLEQPGNYLRMAAWLALLFAGYGLQRGLCAGGLPYDCDSAKGGDVYSALTMLAFTGGALGWLVGVARPARFAWLFTPRRAWVWLLYAAVLPAYSAMCNIPALQVSLAGLGAWSPAAIALKAIAVVAFLAAAAFHVWLAWQSGGSAGACTCASAGGGLRAKPPAVVPADVPDTPSSADGSSDGSLTSRSDGSDSSSRSSRSSIAAGLKALAAHKRSSSRSRGGAAAARAASPARVLSRRSSHGGGGGGGTRTACRRALLLYLLPRLSILAYFGAFLLALPLSGSYSLHLHHYALGWAAASFAAFNHPVSGLLLALGVAVFVQGAGAYGFDPLFTPTHPEGNITGCLPVSSGATGQMTCAFWSDQPFDISFCTNTSWIPWFDCSVEWPWPKTKVYAPGEAPNSLKLAELIQKASGSG